MVANESLSSTRAEFAHAFHNAVEGMMPAALEALFSKASAGGISSTEQRRILNARTILQEKRDEILQNLLLNMGQLLDRSLGTAYSTFRPASALDHSTELALLDSSTFESTLRFNEMTQNFRNRAEQLIIDLNIRIAVLFGQDDIRERENPFRPYLVSRCIFLAIESLRLLPELEAIIIEQLGESLASGMPSVYQAANVALEKQGISAHLSLKISKAPEKPVSRTPGGQNQAAYSSMQTGVFPGAQATGQVGAATTAPANAGFSNQSPVVRLEQLFQSVRGRGNGVPAVVSNSTGGAGAAGMAQEMIQVPASFAAMAAAAMPAVTASSVSAGSGAPGPSWLNGATDLGGALRRAFGEAVVTGHNYQTSADEGALPYTTSTTSTTGPTHGTGVSGAAVGVAPARNIFNPASASHPGGDTVQVPAAFVAEQLQKIAGQARHGVETNLAGEAVPGLLKVLGQMHKVMTPDSATMTDERGEIRNLIREHKDALYSLAKDADEQMTIDIVAMLFEFMLFDELVPFAMRIELGRLQFLILQLALKDRHLLTDGKHPARLLLNRICSIAFSTQQLHDTDAQAQVTEEISRIIKTLLRHDSEVPELFSRIQNRFETFIARELRTNDPHIRRTVKAIGEAEIRFTRFACISAEMAKVLPPLGIDPYFRDFFKNDWVAAIEIAERTDAIQARRYRLLVPDLLWSVFAKPEGDERNLLSSMLPVMLGTLRHGLDLIGWEKERQQKLMNWLADAHAKALRPPDSKKQHNISLPVMHELFEQFTNQTDTVENSEIQDHEFARAQFLVNVLAELSLPARILDAELKKQKSSVDDSIAVEVQRTGQDEEQYLERILSGVLLDFKLGSYMGCVCVRWVNPNISNVVLSMDGEEFPAILSMRSLCEFLASGKIRFVESEPLFERAIHALLKSADAMDNAGVP